MWATAAIDDGNDNGGAREAPSPAALFTRRQQGAASSNAVHEIFWKPLLIPKMRLADQGLIFHQNDAFAGGKAKRT